MMDWFEQPETGLVAGPAPVRPALGGLHGDARRLNRAAPEDVPIVEGEVDICDLGNAEFVPRAFAVRRCLGSRCTGPIILRPLLSGPTRRVP
jgi:hypothetical protein